MYVPWKKICTFEVQSGSSKTCRNTRFSPFLHIHLLTLVWNLGAASAVLWIELSTDTETTLSESLPDLTLVGTLGEVHVGIEDGITSLDEVGVAGLTKIKPLVTLKHDMERTTGELEETGAILKHLHSHAVHDNLHCKIFAVIWNAVLEDWDWAIILAVLVNEVPEDFVEHGAPDGADGVDLVEFVVRGVNERVDVHVGGVWVHADTLGTVVHPSSLNIVGLAGIIGL